MDRRVLKKIASRARDESEKAQKNRDLKRVSFLYELRSGAEKALAYLEGMGEEELWSEDDETE